MSDEDIRNLFSERLPGEHYMQLRDAGDGLVLHCVCGDFRFVVADQHIIAAEAFDQHLRAGYAADKERHRMSDRKRVADKAEAWMEARCADPSHDHNIPDLTTVLSNAIEGYFQDVEDQNNRLTGVDADALASILTDLLIDMAGHEQLLASIDRIARG